MLPADMTTFLLIFFLAQAAKPVTPPPQPDAKLPTYAETVVVTASRTEEKLLNAPASVTVIGQEQIATSAATNVAELLQGVAGLNVTRFNTREYGVASRQPAQAQNTGQLVLLDGRVVNNGGSGMFWDQLPVDADELKQVEILHGPASVVWGSNALNAVINLRTKSPREMQGLRLSAGVGERGVAYGGIRWAQAKGRVSYKVSASLYQHDGWPRKTTLPDGSPAVGPLAYSNPSLRQPKADARLDFDVDDAHRWSFRLGYGGTSGMQFTQDLPFEFDRSTYMAFGDVSYTAPSFDARVYWTRSAGKLRSLLDDSALPFRADMPTADITARKLISPKHLLVYGASARLDFFDVPGVNEDTRHEFGGFVEDQMFLHPKFIVNAGVRVDHVQTSGPAVSPRLSLLMKPAPAHAFRVSVSRAFRAPTPLENFLDVPTGYPLTLAPGLTVLIPFHVHGNDALGEVLSLGFEAGYTGVIRERHTLQITGYRVRASDTIQLGTTALYSPSDPPATWPFPAVTVPVGVLPKSSGYRNTGTITNQGVEASLNSSWTATTWSALSYTFQKTPDLTDADPAFPIVMNEPARHQFSALVGGRYRDWKGSVALLRVGRAYWADVLVADPRLRGFTPAFTLVNASATWAARSGVEFVVKGTNLMNRQVQQHVYGDIISREISAYVNVTVGRVP
jgi:outer membrane receptor for ferrienterochelin and colicins